MKVKIYDQNGIYQTDVTNDDYRNAGQKSLNWRDENFSHRAWEVRHQRLVPSVYLVTIYRENYFPYQCAVYTTEQEAQDAKKALRDLVKQWENIKEAPDGQAPTFQFPKAKENANALNIIQKLMNHNGN